MKALLPNLPLLLLLSLCVHHAFAVMSSYGKQWEWGRYCMPRAIMAADGLTYADGTQIDEVSNLLIQADIEEEIKLFLFAVLIGMSLLLIHAVGKAMAIRQRLAAVIKGNVQQYTESNQNEQEE